MDYYKLLQMGAQLGRQLMASGAEIYRVEESVSRLLTAYGLDPQVFSIPSCLIVSINTPDGTPLTQMYRIPAHGTDIELLERCNDLCRRLCRETPPVEEAQRLVDGLADRCRSFSPRVVLLGYMMAPAFFALFFNGGVRDLLCAAIAGLAVGICVLFGQAFIGSNIFFRTAVCAAVASLLALVLVQIGWGRSPDIITIATLMVLVPGMALTNAMREIMAGDLISGLTRTAETLLVATAIALGTALPLLAGQGLWDAAPPAQAVTDAYLLPCLWAFLACVGFGIEFNIQGIGILICGLGAALGWLIYLLSLGALHSDIFSAFLAAMSISAYSELMARIRHCPVTGYLQVALLPLVPGAGIYRAMQYCIAGETPLFLSTLLHTLGFAAALSVGAMLISSILRVWLPRFRSAR
ncbi:threonine/serine exporter ThrE family protein [uncultured Dysosmobacter sp.]|uniref:threonine/serine ThrE exporter family protein n=1 Tax=uncultured Dysosmobacter sp. TaxID=2591384 RepID=UPI00263136B1|nr:threonine/serine exporter family protein [uncultured Dysosmobacter sp.]